VTANSWSAVDAATVPAKLARELRDAWERFVADSPMEDVESEVRDPIAASWARSRDAGVDPHGYVLAPEVLAPGDVDDCWEQHPLAAAGPLVRECLRETAIESDHLMVVADADGTLLIVDGDVRIRSRAADMMNFAAGTLWSEGGAGTNAIGTALAAGHAVQVFAAEHFTEPVQRWTCAAAPVREPDAGRVIGVVDLTGDFTAVHPHSLTAVVATAQAIESFLRCRMHDEDDLLRARYAHLLEAVGARRALVRASGRLLAGRLHGAAPGERITLPEGGGEFALHGGAIAVAEPTAAGEAFIVSQPESRPAARARAPRLHLRLLGTEHPQADLDGREIALRPRHADLLVLLEAHPRGTDAEQLSVELYGDRGNPASVRVEMSRLRRLFPGCLDAERYALAVELDSDAEHVRRALRAGSIRLAAERYRGCLLERSEAPGVVRQRDELDGWVRNAVLTSDDCDAMWHWVQTSSGDQDLMAWSRLLGALPYDDARRPKVAAHLGALRQELQTPV
jgi:hypothetical protein